MSVDAPSQQSDHSIMTVGHSTRTLADFLQLLHVYQVTLLVDIRTIPRSRYNPQFNQETFSQALKHAGIRYAHLPALGGLRKARPDSINTAWRNSSFRGFADYMQTDTFERGIASLLQLAIGHCAALMCAEAVPWRCHRSLVADALVVRGVEVTHVLSETRHSAHALNPSAQAEGLRVTYPSRGATVDSHRGKVGKAAETRSDVATVSHGGEGDAVDADGVRSCRDQRASTGGARR